MYSGELCTDLRDERVDELLALQVRPLLLVQRGRQEVRAGRLCGAAEALGAGRAHVLR